MFNSQFLVFGRFPLCFSILVALVHLITNYSKVL